MYFWAAIVCTFILPQTAIGLVLFGIIEYINYYWYQLSYGASGFNIKILLDKGLQKSSIAKTIDKKS